MCCFYCLMLRSGLFLQMTRVDVPILHEALLQFFLFCSFVTANKRNQYLLSSRDLNSKKQKHLNSPFSRIQTATTFMRVYRFVALLSLINTNCTNLHVGRLRLQLGQVVGVVLQLLSQVGVLHLQHLHLPQQLVVGRRRHAAGATTDLRRRRQAQTTNERIHQ